MPVYNKNNKLKIKCGDNKIKKVFCGGNKLYSCGNTVTYYVDHNIVHTEEVDEGASILSPSSFTPSKEGYTFRGWRSDAAASGSILTAMKMGDNALALYAVFQKNITLSYNGNGCEAGNTEAQTGICYYNNGNVMNPVFTLNPNGFVNAGHAFCNWAMGSTEGSRYAAGASVTLSENTILYACWVQKSYSFEYTGSIQQFKAPATGTYLLEAWGASGGDAIQERYDFGTWFYSKYYGGPGGYSRGLVSLKQGDILNICVGSRGASGPHNIADTGESIAGLGNAGGYNGGGMGYSRDGRQDARTGGGGGATSITKGPDRGTLIFYKDHRDEILIAAGGGGGAYGWLSCDDEHEDYSRRGIDGGSGGGSTGGCNINEHWQAPVISANTGGNQSAGGSRDIVCWDDDEEEEYIHRTPMAGAFGQGGSATGWYDVAAGGGGGYFGGATGADCGVSAGGGSGYIGGVTNGSMQSGANKGNGRAIIEFMG